MSNLQIIARNIGKTLTKNSPTILTAISVGGLVATTVMAVRATPKAMLLIDQLGVDPEPKEIIKATWKLYAPAAFMGVLTVCSIVGANSINLRRNAALVSLYSLSEACIKEYKNKIVEVVGEKEARKIKQDIVKDRMVANPAKDDTIAVTGKGETLCYDALSGRYFKSDIESIRQALNKLSRDLMSEMTITLNEVYFELGLSSTTVGEHLCWHIDDGLIEPDFSSHLTDKGIPCLVIDYKTEPRYDYNNY
jgi:hypothetical protein